MPLLAFSEPSHIVLLLQGTKRQTTRQPRKRPLKVGDILYCYYRPRMKKSCNNCILKKDYGRGNCQPETERIYCDSWSNYFGEAVITNIIKVGHVAFETDNYRKLFWRWSADELEKWAIADGFEGFYVGKEHLPAQDWFFRKTGRSDWKELDWDIITFEPNWLQKREGY